MQYLGNKPVQGISRTANLANVQALIPYIVDVNKGYISSDGSVIKLPTLTAEGGNGIFYGPQQKLKALCPTLKAGDTATISWTSNYNNIRNFIYLKGSRREWKNGTSITITQEDLDGNVYFYSNSMLNGETEGVIMYDFMINLGATALPHQPYLQRYDMYMYDNLIKMPYYSGNNSTHNGITFTIDEQTGWIIANGTSTAIADFNLVKSFTLTIPAHSIIKGCPNGGGGSTYEIQIFRNSDSAGTPHKTFNSIGENNNGVNTFGEFVAQFVRIRIRGGVTANNLVFKPELLRLIGD